MVTVSKTGNSSLERSPDNSVWTNIPDVRSFDDGDMQAEQLDTSSYDTGNQRRYTSGLKDASDGSFVVWFDPSNTVHQALIADAGGATIYLRKKYGTRHLVMPVNIISTSNPDEVGAAYEMTVTFRPASEPTWADVT